MAETSFVPDEQSSFVPDNEPSTFVADEHAPSSFVPDTAAPATKVSSKLGPIDIGGPAFGRGLPGKMSIESAANTFIDKGQDEPYYQTAFDEVMSIGHEIKEAAKGLNWKVGVNSYFPTISATRFVDKSGAAVDTDDINSGKVPMSEVHEEDPLNYFLPSLRGEAKPKMERLEKNGAVAQAFSSQNPPEFLETLHSEWLGAKEGVKDPQSAGIYKYFLNPMSQAEQTTARMVTYGLSKIGQMPPEDAKAMLSQEEVHNHDIVDYYVSQNHMAKGATARILWGAAGAVTDLVDPLVWAGAAQKVTKFGSEAIQYGGRMITDFAQMSRMEGQHFKLAHDVEKIILATGHTAEAGATEANLEALNKFRDSSPGSPNPFTFSDLKGEVQLPREAVQALEAAQTNRLNPSIVGDFASGERQLVMKVPFTDHALEVPFVSDIIRKGGQLSAEAMLATKQALGTAAESAGRFLALQSPDLAQFGGKIADSGAAIGRGIMSMATDTTRPLFNMSARVFINDEKFARGQLNQFKETWYKAFLGESGKIDGTQLFDVMTAIEKEPLRENDWYRANAQNAAAFPSWKGTLQVNKLDAARAEVAEMTKNFSAEQLQLKNDIQTQTRQMNDSYRARGLTLNELDPLQEGNGATGYIKHMLTKEYLSTFKDSEAAAAKAAEYLSNRHPGMDASMFQRTIKDTVANTNASYAAANNGMKMFVEDPIVAHTTRMAEMQNNIRRHDLVKSLEDYFVIKHSDELPPEARGWVKMDPKTWGQNANVATDTGWSDQFMPTSIRTAMDSGKNVWVPEDVATRMRYLLNPYANGGSKGGLFTTAARAANTLFRNVALFGPGYLGTRFMSHVMTTLYSGTSIPKLFDAISVLTPELRGAEEAEKIFELGGLKMTKSQIFDQATKDGMIRTGMMTSDDWGNVVENIASVSKERSLLKESMTVADHAMMFSTNRAISHAIDDIPKLAHYMDKLEQGYTFKGAAESAEFWFYNHNMAGEGQKLATQIIPFTSTGIKTMEQTLQAFRETNVAHLTLPAKVNAVLAGDYVDDPETRRFMRDVIPAWQKSSIFGPIIPGGRQLVMEFPWVWHTVSAIFNPTTMDKGDLNSLPVNPLIKLTLMGLAGLSSLTRGETTDPEQIKSVLTDAAADFLPPAIKHALTVYQLTHPEQNFLIDFSKWYVPKGALDPNKTDTERMQKYQNAQELGKWMESIYGGNTFINAWLGGALDRPPMDTLTVNTMRSLGLGDENDAAAKYKSREDNIAAGLGNYVKGHIRNLTFGLVRETALDVDVFSRVAAIQRQGRVAEDALKASVIQSGYDQVAGAIGDPETQQRILKDRPDEQKALVAKYMALEDKAKALLTFYGSVIKDHKENTGIYRQIFGIEPNKVDLMMRGTDKLNVKNSIQERMKQGG